MKKSNSEIFIEKAIAKFGNKFDYSKVEYINSRTEVCIICPEHGEFYTLPVQFLNSKYGCSKCFHAVRGKQCRKSTEDFLKECKNIWNNKYTYEKTVYETAEKKVIVTCPIHGDFLTRPADFIRGHGCPKCKGDRTKNLNKESKRDTLIDFINKGKLLYGDLFSYENVIYVNSRIKVLIHSNLCNEDFLITPSKFLHGGVKNKYLGKDNKWDKLTKEIFIQRARLTHSNLYDYDKVNYVDVKTNVCITCPKHGEFWQTPIDHLWNRTGCPICAQSHGETVIYNVLTEMNLKFERQFQINISDKKLYIDFMYKHKDKVIFIEYNGIQHYEPNEYFGGIEQFKKQISRDNILREYCKNNNIRLLEYPYTISLVDLSELIKEDLDKICNN